jgi:hypothetical protein
MHGRESHVGESSHPSFSWGPGVPLVNVAALSSETTTPPSTTSAAANTGPFFREAPSDRAGIRFTTSR